MPFFSGQGKVFAGTRDVNGNAQAFRYLGNCAALSVSLETDVLEHKESTSGQRLTDLRLIRQKTAQFSAQLEEFEPKNLALAMYGADSTIAAGSFVDPGTPDTLPSGIVAQDFVRLRRQDISSLSIKDSAGSPATLTLNTHYRIESAKHGSIQFLNVGTFVQPFKAFYTFAAATNVNMLTGALPERWFRFEGLNTADGNKPVLVELYRVALNPLRELGLISDELLQMELSGNGLYDATKAADAELGQFGRIVLLA